jgi:hypothetical protein
MKRFVATAMCTLFSLNCASIIHQTTQQVPIKSDPPGAAMTVSCGDVNNDPKLITPAVVTLHRKPDHCSVTLRKEGYADKFLAFDKQMSGLYIANILIGGIVGFIVDAANGAMWNRTPGEVSVKLDSITSNTSVVSADAGLSARQAAVAETFGSTVKMGMTREQLFAVVGPPATSAVELTPAGDLKEIATYVGAGGKTFVVTLLKNVVTGVDTK